MSHKIIRKYGPKRFYCEVCDQSWFSKPRVHCPGVPVMYLSQFGTLRTLTQLHAAGFETDHRALPKPAGCYRSGRGGSKEYVYLYDYKLMTVRTLKRAVIRRSGWLREIRLTRSLVQVVGLLPSNPLVHGAENDFRIYDQYVNLCCDLINSVAAVQFFTSAEIETMGEACYTVAIAPIEFRRGVLYSLNRPSRRSERGFVARGEDLAETIRTACMTDPVVGPMLAAYDWQPERLDIDYMEIPRNGYSEHPNQNEKPLQRRLL